MSPNTPTDCIQNLRWMVLAMLLAMGACVSPPPVNPPAPTKAQAPREQPASPPLVVTLPTPTEPPLTLVSKARTDREFRQDAARHIYKQNAHRIYNGQLPPLLKAVGVMDVVVDRRGHVLRVEWRRAPKHAPDVMKEIERTVLAAAPYPAPVNLGEVTYTETWLWDKSGRFQLDTLTEGQR